MPQNLPTNLIVGSTSHVAHHNALHALANTDTADQEVRYVSKDGSDSNDGTSWGSAKLTVGAAVSSLPVITGAQHWGRVYVGTGTFDESKINFSARLGIIGSGNSAGGVLTTIRLASGQDTHLFESTASGSAQHGCVLRDITLDGNKANQTTDGDFDVLVVHGGFNCVLDNVNIKNASRYGVRVTGGHMNVAMRSMSWSGNGSANTGGGLYVENIASGEVLVDEFQMDQNGVYPIRISSNATDTMAYVAIRNGKCENQSGNAALGITPIRFEPFASAGGGVVHIDIENFWANNVAGTTDQYTAVVEEATATGRSGRFTLRQVQAGTQYAKAFSSAKTSQASLHRDIRYATFEGYESSVDPPAYQFNGIGIWAGTGSPENALSAPVGALFLRTNGGASTTLYIKESGTGNTGWVAK